MSALRSRHWPVKRSLFKRVVNYTLGHDTPELVAIFGERFRRATAPAGVREEGAFSALVAFMKAVEAPPVDYELEAHAEMLALNKGQPRTVAMLNVMERMAGRDQAWEAREP